jgi:hypothetical protein
MLFAPRIKVDQILGERVKAVDLKNRQLKPTQGTSLISHGLRPQSLRLYLTC